MKPNDAVPNVNTPPSAGVAVDAPNKLPAAEEALVEKGSLRDEAAFEGKCPAITTSGDTDPIALDESEAASFCQRFKEKPLPVAKRPKIFYAVMVGYEFDMLEVALAEVFPLLDHIFVTESTTTHSKKSKPLFFERIKARYERFMSKITHLVFSPRKKYKSGWDIEKRQRSHFLASLMGEGGKSQHNITTGDIVIANVDLDEIFSRTLLKRYRFCDVGAGANPSDHSAGLHFDVFHFRYHLHCLMESVYSRYYSTVFRWPKVVSEVRNIDLYKRRVQRRNFGIKPNDLGTIMNANGTLVWHMTAFGGIDAVMRKNQNSPHTHLRPISRGDIAKLINECIYNDEKRFKVDPPDALLPAFVQANMCRFKQMGWLGPQPSP